ncbi:hypothetical protein SGQ83_00530 [Flavobacterium sp. Fl-318]|uniref:DUF4468 domain-containing protein n=1 Tax=Flavobacterium cupriresistens TaxID=2893885 RepID=A0ABU4R5F8_9FLAO|nr:MULTISPECIES: hypothetical protein [unclassified Flavobacterium]MDX6187822.1 hypothetical protein [Flavobacterium sp. Fl-318]UFH42256.1 hypothetical protein LNP23_20920 [Flavobacterium sp. F-323]
MRKLLLICLLGLYSLSSYAQDKATLTKEETVNYIQKKLNEGIGHKMGDRELKNIKISISECKITITRKTKNSSEDLGNYTTTYSSYKSNLGVYTFDPRLISSVTETSPASGSLKWLTIKLKSKSGTYSYWNEYYASRQKKTWAGFGYGDGGGNYTYSTYYEIDDNKDDKVESTDSIELLFLGSDTTNFNKLKKAFEHLRDLCSAEDDPFGE